MNSFKMPYRSAEEWVCSMQESSMYDAFAFDEIESFANALEYAGREGKIAFYIDGAGLVSLPSTPYTDAGDSIPELDEMFSCPTNTETTNKQTKEIPMSFPTAIPSTTDQLVSKFFTRVAGVVIDVQTGKLGVKTQDGIVTLNNAACELQPFAAFNLPIPAYAVRTPIEQLAEGDIILQDNMKSPVFVLVVEGDRVLAITPEGMNVEFTPVKNTLLGSSGIMVVKNMFSQSTEGANSLLPLLLMKEMGGGSFEDDKLGLLLAMQGGGVSASGGMAGMLPLLLMGGGDISAEKLLLMQMMGGFGAK